MSSHSPHIVATANSAANELPCDPAAVVGEPWKWGRTLGKLVSRDIFSTVVSSFVLFGMTCLQGILLARMLGPEARGQYATGVFYTQTLTYIGLFGTHFAVTRWAARRQGDVIGLAKVTSRLGLLTGITTMAAVAFLAYFALPSTKQSLAPLCVLCSLFLPLEHVRLLRLGIDQGRGDFRRYNASRLVAGAAFPLLLGVAWLSGVGSALVASMLFVVAPLVGLAYQQTPSTLASEFRPSRREPTVKRILQRGRPYALAVLVSDLCDRLDIFLFLWLATFTIQGYYAVAVPTANLLLVTPIALATFAFNAGARHDQQITPAIVTRNSVAILSVQILAAVAFALILEPLMVLVLGEPFRAAAPLTMALLPAYTVAGCGRVAEAYLQGRNKSFIGVYTRLVGAAVMCTFIYFTFGRWAEFSIPLGALAGYLVSTSILLAAIVVDARESTASALAVEAVQP